MLCFKCKNEEFEIREVNVRQEFRGEQFDVTSPASICTCCGWRVLGKGQTDILRKRTADEYRQKHRLLTSAEILHRRTARAMSQEDFADFLGVSVASVKRWELGFVQEPVYDRLMRQKCDCSPFHCTIWEPMAGYVSEGIVLNEGNYHIKSVWIEVASAYPIAPVIRSSNVTTITSRVTGDELLAAVSKEWRKNRGAFCDVELTA